MKGRADSALPRTRVLAPGAALRLSPAGLVVSAAGLFRVTSGSASIDKDVYDTLSRSPDGDGPAVTLAAQAVLDILQRRGVTVLDERDGWCDWAGLSGPSAAPPEGEGVATTARIVVADATDPRLAAWAGALESPEVPWTMAWLTPRSLAVSRNAGGRGCAFCALFFDGELARGALPAGSPPSPWLFSPALRALASAMLQTAVDLGQETLPDHHAWWLDLSSLRAAVELVPSLPGCRCRDSAQVAAPDHADARSPARATGRRFAPVHPVPPQQMGEPWRFLYRGTKRLDRVDRRAFGVAMASGEDASLRAEGEAVERFCMMHARPDVSGQTAAALSQKRWSDADINGQLFTSGQYDRLGFRFGAFHDRAPLDWSWAERLGTGERALVPTSLAGHVDDGGTRLVDATSSGYAAHTDRDQAITHALLELVERDALLGAWLGEGPLVVLEGLPLPAGCRAYLVPSAVRLPVVLIAADTPLGGVRLASAAALSLESAAQKASDELSVAQAPLEPRARPARGDVPALNPLCDAVHAAAARSIPADHVLFYDHPERGKPVLDWLSAAISEETPHAPKRFSAPLEAADETRMDTAPGARSRRALRQVLAALDAAGLDPWIVDRSLPALFDGWHVVRAIVPGFLEMSWGAAYLRAAGARAQTLLASRDAGAVAPHPFG